MGVECDIEVTRLQGLETGSCWEGRGGQAEPGWLRLIRQSRARGERGVNVQRSLQGSVTDTDTRGTSAWSTFGCQGDRHLHFHWELLDTQNTRPRGQRDGSGPARPGWFLPAGGGCGDMASTAASLSVGNVPGKAQVCHQRGEEQVA